MKKNIANLNQKTYESLKVEVSLEKRLEDFITICKSEADDFEKLDSEIDLEYQMFTLLEELEKKNLWREIEKLDLGLQCQPKYYEDYSKYISQALIPLYLAEDRENSIEQKSRIEDYLNPFYKSPDESCEILYNVLDKLICYDRSSIAVDLCKKTYTQIANSEELIFNPEDEIADVIVWDGLQNIYTKLKSNMNVDWISFDKSCKAYKFKFTQDDFKSFEEVMTGHLDLTHMLKTFKKKILSSLFQINLAFCCQMYDLDGTSFVTSNNFASKIIEFLSTIPGREKSPLHTFFKITPNLLRAYLRKLIASEWFDSIYKQFAFLGALPVFYQVLCKIGIIEMKTIEEILPTIIALKREYEELHLSEPWKFNFINKLEKQFEMLRPHDSCATNRDHVV